MARPQQVHPLPDLTINSVRNDGFSCHNRSHAMSFDKKGYPCDRPLC